VAVRTLEKLGRFQIDVAANGLEALEALERKRPLMLVLMDCQMPKMDGFEATRDGKSRGKSNGPTAAQLTFLVWQKALQNKRHSDCGAHSECL
jgi:CheY-like chemotaxis protein